MHAFFYSRVFEISILQEQFICRCLICRGMVYLSVGIVPLVGILRYNCLCPQKKRGTSACLVLYHERVWIE